MRKRFLVILPGVPFWLCVSALAAWEKFIVGVRRAALSIGPLLYDIDA